MFLTSIRAESKNLVNFSAATSGSFVSSDQNPPTIDIKFRSLSGFKNERYESSYQFCDNLCYSIGIGYFHQKINLAKYSEINPSYLAFQLNTDFIYSTFRMARMETNNSELGVTVNLGNENLKIEPYAGLATAATTNSYIAIEGGPYLRYNFLSLSSIKLERIFVEFGGHIAIRNNNDITLNNETIASRDMGKLTILLYLGLGISF